MIKWILGLLFPLVALGQQGMMPGPGTPASSSIVTESTYTYVGYTFVAEGASFPSPSINLAAGDFVSVFCTGAGTSATTFSVSSSPFNTFSSLSSVFVSNTGSLNQEFYILNAHAGPTTFTCSQGGTGAGGFKSAVVMQFHHSGSGATFNASSDVSASVKGSPFVSKAFLTGPPSLVVYCNRPGNNSTTFTASAIGGVTATMGGVSASSLGTASDAGCEYRIIPASTSAITSSIASSSSGTSGVSGGAFN